MASRHNVTLQIQVQQKLIVSTACHIEVSATIGLKKSKMSFSINRQAKLKP
jgi:hypothetical protein